MVVASEKPLFIQLDIPTSPLLSSLQLDDDSPSASPPPSLPSLSSKLLSEMIPFSKMGPSISSSTSSLHRADSHPVPEITITSPLSEPTYDERPTSRPRPASRLSSAASKTLVQFIDLLEKVDRDMATEIEHVKESIRETREYIEEWQEERSTRGAALLKKKERVRRGTTLPDSDFWFSM
ncbi:hypothetical protein BC827DRAFT_1228818 [Russula dissimulans]|nr:hypothetical protein BC827DRAFT_1228818 [Russula dissimulans]